MYKKILAYTVLSAVFLIIGFGGGYFIAKQTIPSRAVEEKAANTLPTLESYNPEISAVDESVPSVKYLLKNENNVLNLYCITNEIQTVIKSVEFNSSFLPSDDRIKLEKGIYFDTIEDGFSLIEDFTS